MKLINHTSTLFFVIAGVIGIIFVIELLLGNSEILTYMTLVTGPSFGLVIGLMSINKFSQEGVILGADQFSAMNAFFGLGVVVLTLSEILTSIVWSLPNQQEYISVIFILQLPGLLLWSIGVSNYFQGCLRVINDTGARRAFGWITVATIVTTAIIVQISDIQFIEILTVVPGMVVLLITLYALAWLEWKFRYGRLRIPLGLLLLATGLFLLQSLAWNVMSIIPTNGVARALTTESYLIIGGTQAMNDRL